MNIFFYIQHVMTRLSQLFLKAFFMFIQKPFYDASYNHENKFSCHGLLINSSIKLIGKGNKIMIEDGVILKNVKIKVSGKNNTLIINKNVKFYDKSIIVIENENNTLEIGKNFDFQGCSFIVREYDTKVTIGKDCMFSSNIFVRNGNSHTIYDTCGIKINYAKDVIVEDKVWVGYGATILKGSVIGENSIVGTQSVVAGLNVPKGSIVAGNPARILKQGIYWGRERIK